MHARLDVSWTNQNQDILAMSIEAKLRQLQAIQNLLAPYRYLYCVDLEATCDEVGESESPRPPRSSLNRWKRLKLAWW